MPFFIPRVCVRPVADASRNFSGVVHRALWCELFNCIQPCAKKVPGEFQAATRWSRTQTMRVSQQQASKGRPRASFSYAETAENDLENILSSGPAGDLSESIKCGMQIYGHQLRCTVAQQTRDSLSECGTRFFKGRAMPALAMRISEGEMPPCLPTIWAMACLSCIDARMVQG